MDRRAWIWGGVLATTAAGLCALPLFDLLGYEFSFALALIVSIAGLDLGVAGARQAPGVFASWARVTVRTWLLLLGPLALSLSNALRVRNCNLAGGLLWYALLPGVSAPVACAVGVASARITRHARLAAYGIFVGSLVWALWRFVAAPPVNAFHPFGGYFPGTLYDEEVAVPRALWWARLYHLSAAAAILSVAAYFCRRRWWLWLTLIPTLALGVLGGRLGFSRSARDIARALGGERRTAHFVLHYSPTGPFAKELDLQAADFELRWVELSRLFQIEPSQPVHAFLFDSAAHKQSLMGAARTSVAKPWRKEIYLQYEPWPHSVVMHELAHVFAGAFGDRLLHVSRRGAALNLGLIEGVAVAASWHGSSSLTPHEQAHVMRQAHIAPPLERVMGLGFLGFNGAAAYAEAGSFCRWLLEARGAAPLERVYREGGSEASFRAAYGVSRAQLFQEWGRFVDALEVPDRAHQLAEERLAQPSVFHKVCAHELALRRDEAAHAGTLGDHAREVQILKNVCADDPDDPDNLAEVMDAERSARLDGDARATAEKLLAHPKATPQLRARALALDGDLALAKHDLPSARAAYAAAEALPLDEGAARLVTVKRLTAQMAAPPEELTRFVLDGGRDAAAALAATEELARRFPEDGLYQYLLGRQLEARAQWSRAAETLERSRALGLPDARFVREADRLSGRCRYREGRMDLARADFSRLLNGAGESLRLVAEDWLRRIELDGLTTTLAAATAKAP
jgi:tetratricopeptide (TPR) repeat protein